MTIEAANQLFRQGQFPAARKILQRLLKKGQNVPAALRLLGYIEGQLRNFPGTIDFLSRSLRYDPSSVESWYYLGLAHQRMEQHGAAVDAFQRTLKLAPDLFEATHDLGLSLLAMGRNADAAAQFEKAANLNPKSFEAHLNHGAALGKLRRYEAEIASYGKALAIDANNRTLLENYGAVLCQTGKFAQAVAHYQSVLSRHPDFEFARGGLLFAKANAGDWDDFDRQMQDLHLAIAAGKDCIDPFELVVLPSTQQEQLQVARRYSSQHFPALETPLYNPHRPAGDRLRIAYLSADFCTHAVAFLMAGVFESHDRSRFEVTAISIGKNDHSPIRQRLEDAVEKFVDATDKSDEEIARLIADLNVDVLIDLMGYTKDARPGVLARRPAPIQIGHLGFPGTSGSTSIDYFVADQFVIPADQRQFFSEKIIYLPGCYQPNDSSREIAVEPLTRSDAGLRDDQFVYCNFNGSHKINPKLFDIWMRLLSQVESSILWLVGESAQYEKNLRNEAIKRGVSQERLIFASRVDLKTYLRRMQLADVFLDNFPYNAHGTASDALWAGLPLVTCVGATFAGRVAGSLLTAAGLPELITRTPEDYEQLALELAKDRAKLGQIRARLETSGRASALFDSRRYTRHLEDAYVAAWARHRASEAPDHIFA